MNKKKWIRPVLLLVWMGVIFWFSSQNAVSSDASSGKIVTWILNHFYPGYQGMNIEAQKDVAGHLSFFVRKTAHFTEYLILGVLFLWNLRLLSWKPRTCAIAAWGFATLYAAGDEFHQMFSDGRSPQIRDVCIDSLGAFTGIAVAMLLLLLYNRHKRKKYGTGNAAETMQRTR